MKTFVLLLWLGLSSGWPAAQAQCLSLRQLIAIGTEPAAFTRPEKAVQLPAGEWSFQGTVVRSNDIYWHSTRPSTSGHPRAVLTLRSQQQSVDVVLKTTDAACMRQVRTELKDLQLTFVNVTCPGGCEAQRYDGTQFQTTLYSNMRGDYPYVLVVHPRSASAVPAASGGKAGEGVTTQ